MLTQEDFISLLATTLRQARQDKKFTLEKLAEKSETDYSTVSLIENGRQNPKIYTVYRLLYALDIDIAELIAGRSREMLDGRFAALSKLEKLELQELEALCEFVDSFEITQKH